MFKITLFNLSTSFPVKGRDRSRSSLLAHFSSHVLTRVAKFALLDISRRYSHILRAVQCPIAFICHVPNDFVQYRDLPERRQLVPIGATFRFTSLKFAPRPETSL